MDTNISSHTSQQTETNASSHIHIRIHEFTVSLEKLSKFLPKTSNANFVSNKHKEKSYFLHVRLAMLFDFDFGNRSYFRNDISTDAHRVCRCYLKWSRLKMVFIFSAAWHFCRHQMWPVRNLLLNTSFTLPPPTSGSVRWLHLWLW